MKKVANQNYGNERITGCTSKALGTPYPNTTARAPVVTTRAPSTPAAKTPRQPNQQPAPHTPPNGSVPKNTGGNAALTK